MVYVFLAEGFEEIEALTPVDMLRRAGVEVKTVGVTGKSVTGRSGITVVADIDSFENIPEDLEMIILPGGMPGAENLDRSPLVEKYINAALERDIYIGAICAAPMILGKRGILKGKSATCYPGFEQYLEGATHYDAAVVFDGGILTSNGVGGALDFALECVTLVKGEAEAERIREAVLA